MAEKLTLVIPTKVGTLEVECFPTEHPQIVIHRTVFEDKSPNERMGFWNVSHRASGFAFVQKLPNRECAEIAARYLGSCGLDLDGDKDIVEASGTKQFRRALKALKANAGDCESAMIYLFRPLGIVAVASEREAR